MERILLADDDTGLCELLTEFLESEGFKVESINDGEKAASKALAERFSLVILDVMLQAFREWRCSRRSGVDPRYLC